MITPVIGGVSRTVLAAFLILAIGAGVAAAQPPQAQGPPTVPVQIVNVPLPVTGAVLARLSPELFFQSSAPTCDALNRCFVKFPTVPAGKRLRLTRIHGAMYFSDRDAFVAVDINDLNHQLLIRPLPLFPAAYFGPMLSFNEATDLVFEAGQTPLVEVGTSSEFPPNAFNRLGITGELITIQQ
jgi:hypothetical protein